MVAAFDPNDSVGILDQYFPQTAFFTEFERFDRHLEKIKRAGNPIDYLVVCSPNYLHDAHVRYGLRCGAQVICEKPLVINPWNLDALQDMEIETGKKVLTILQLRYHATVIALKEIVLNAPPSQIFDLDLQYITPRGQWYQASWKGDETKSGGIITNIGIHLFDMLIWVFGAVKNTTVTEKTATKASGTLSLEKANVRWTLSIDAADLAVFQTDKPVRQLNMDGKNWNFSEGFTDLHTESYRQILAGNGWGIEGVRPSVALAATLRGS